MSFGATDRHTHKSISHLFSTSPIIICIRCIRIPGGEGSGGDGEDNRPRNGKVWVSGHCSLGLRARLCDSGLLVARFDLPFLAQVPYHAQRPFAPP